MGIGRKSVVEQIMMNSGEMEKKKKMEFTTKKSKWMMMKTGRGRCEEIEVETKQGMIQKAERYKYLGNWVNEGGNMDTQLEEVQKKVPFIIREANIVGGRENVGSMEVNVKILLYEKVIVPTIFYNLEVWTNMRKKDIERMEIIQGNVLKGLLRLPKATPYWGILIELGIWPVEWQLKYRKMMLYHQILISKDDRKIKRIILEQKKNNYKECWYSEIVEIGNRTNVEIDTEIVRIMKKSVWKEKVKMAVDIVVKGLAVEKIESMKKLRFLKEFGRKKYIEELNGYEVIDALKIKLNMVESIMDNYGKRMECVLCNSEETTEHIITCNNIPSEWKEGCEVSILGEEEKENVSKLIELFKKTGDLKKEKIIEEMQEMINEFVIKTSYDTVVKMLNISEDGGLRWQ